jgi:hypothetical protein
MEHAILVYLALALVAYTFLYCNLAAEQTTTLTPSRSLSRPSGTLEKNLRLTSPITNFSDHVVAIGPQYNFESRYQSVTKVLTQECLLMGQICQQRLI